MRTSDVRTGQTYLVEVPSQMSDDQYSPERWGFAYWWRLIWLKGSRFPLTVTAIDTDSAGAVMAEGLRVHHRSHAEVEVTPEQAASLGLPPGDYRVTGILTDTDGRRIAVPDVETMRVPVSWLRPLDEQRSPTHRNLSDDE